MIALFAAAKSRRSVAVLAVVAAAATAPVASAAFTNGVVNGDFDARIYHPETDTDTYTATYTGQGALPSSGSNWNSLRNPSFNGNLTFSNLLDSQGVATDVSVSIDSGTGNSGTGNNAVDFLTDSSKPDTLFQDYYYNFGTSDSTVTFSGLTPGQEYNVYLYDGFGSATFTLGNQSKTLSVDYNRGSFVKDTNYAVLSGVADTNGGLAATISLAGGDRRPLSGFQIAAVPEPTTLAALGLVTAGVLRRRRSV